MDGCANGEATRAGAMLLEAAIGMTVFSKAEAMVGESLVLVVQVKHGAASAFVDARFEVLVAGGAAVFEDEVVAAECNKTGSEVIDVDKVADVAMLGIERIEFLGSRIVVFLAAVFDAVPDFWREVGWHKWVAGRRCC